MHISGPAISQMERRDYVRPDTTSRYLQSVVTAVRERAIAGLLGAYVASTVSEAAERGVFVREIA
jgi:hypothetical protein